MKIEAATRIDPHPLSPSLRKVEGEGKKEGREVWSEGDWTAEVATIRVRFGDGVLSALGEEAAALLEPTGGHRVLLVTDPGLEAVGHARRAVVALREAGLALSLIHI